MASQVDRFYPNSRDAGDCPFAGDAEAIRGHVGDKANPHAVTAGQVGAYTKAEAAAAISAHAGRTDNPHKVTAAQVGALTEAAANDRYVRVPPDAETIVLNHLLRGLRFYAHNDAEAGPDGNSPFFVIGSQLSGGQLREDRWVAKLFYNAIEFLRAPGTERVRLEFNRPGAAARATSDAIVLWKELVAQVAAHDADAAAHADLRKEMEKTDTRVASLEERVAELLYVAIAFTGGSSTPSEAEIGASVASVVLKWTTNKTPATLTLDGTALGTAETTRTMAGPFTTNKTWALRATDERGAAATRTLSLTFKSKAYWGVGTATGGHITSAVVNGLSGQAFATGRGRTFTANAGAGQYIYYVFPKAWGTPTFKVGGFEGGFALDREWVHVNASGGKVPYQAWRSTNAALGSTTVVVS